MMQLLLAACFSAPAPRGDFGPSQPGPGAAGATSPDGQQAGTLPLLALTSDIPASDLSAADNRRVRVLELNQTPETPEGFDAMARIALQDDISLARVLALVPVPVTIRAGQTGTTIIGGPEIAGLCGGVDGRSPGGIELSIDSGGAWVSGCQGRWRLQRWEGVQAWAAMESVKLRAELAARSRLEPLGCEVVAVDCNLSDLALRCQGDVLADGRRVRLGSPACSNQSLLPSAVAAGL